MALDLTGISNVGEFYSHHYLDALLEKDIKGLLSRWERDETEGGAAGPHKELSRCAEAYFKAKGRILDTASDDDRFDETHALNVRIAEALGYTYRSGAYEFIEDDVIVPVLASLERDGHPYLWIVEAVFADEERPPLEEWPLACQQPAGAESHDLPGESWESIIARIFRRGLPPRWVLLMAGSRLILAERHKWGQGKYLLFDVDELLSRRETTAIRATAALLARDSLSPEDGAVLHDTLDENSHKHAYAVSEDLKYGVRRAVELLANEYIWYQRNTAKQAIFGDEELARKLTVECLRYLYRLLFLFYAEARGGDVGVVPMKSEEYRQGYSLDALRDLEQVPLTTEEAQNGYFLDTSLRKLFSIVNKGHTPQQLEFPTAPATPSGSDYRFEADEPKQHGTRLSISPDDTEPETSGARATATLVKEAKEQEAILDHGFTVEGLKSPLFDPKSTPLLTAARLRNVVLQEIIEALSLSQEGGRGRRRRRRERGRISYAELGINQLGAVYEGLLSYSGFFAQETLYEVKPAGAAATDETQQSYFIPESEIEKYKEDEFVYEESEGPQRERRRRRKRYPKGGFIFRLAGRDRQKSASYYTPECLTQCVVKYSLKELLEKKTADEILKLTICEPAMGSGAFLNEAISQLADAYLEKKKQETGNEIPPSDYALERQRVKAYLATHNAYGVDLNPVAVELAQVSIWLNTIHQGSRCPWFELRMAVGNSLIGARRQVFRAKDLTRRSQRSNPNWLDLVPEDVPLGPEWTARPSDSVYHFLLPADGMAAFDRDTVIRGLAPDDTTRIAAWRREFTKPFDKADAKKLSELSDRIDALWKQVVLERQRAVRETEQPIAVWGQPQTGARPRDIESMRRVAERFERTYTAYRRLKLVMDYWCALWFWPIEASEKLPTRDVFLMDLELILEGTVTAKVEPGVVPGILPGEEIPEEHRDFLGQHGIVDVDELYEKVERFRIVRDVAERVRFHHWELRFAEVFADRGGFDLIVGNPPWVKVEWNEGGILSEIEPLLDIRGVSASNIARKRSELLTTPQRIRAYCGEYVEQTGAKSFLNARVNYPLLQKVQTNSYKCFVTRSWRISSDGGVSGFLHPEGIFDDPKGGRLRAAAYSRLRGHFQFVNERALFPDVSNHAKFSVNAYRGRRTDGIPFDQISNLFDPKTIDDSFGHDGHGAVPGIKNSDDEWDLRPHRRRIVQVDRDNLSIFAKLYDEPGTPATQARLPVVHSEEIVRVLEKFAAQPRRLGDLEGEYFATVMFDETYAQRDGTIRRETRYPKDPSEWILSGPHFFVGTPLNKTPNEGCSTNRDYSRIDLTAIPEDYLPRTNYVPACPAAEYLRRTPHWKGRPVTEFYRHVHRRQLSPTGERTLINALAPPGTHHIDSIVTVVFSDPELLLVFSGLCSSLVFDFLIKTTGKGDLRRDLLSLIPLPTSRTWNVSIIQRVIQLNCLIALFGELWKHSSEVTWERDRALRTDLSRRQALVELDALAALALDLTEEELLTIYRVQFPVLRQYERERRYDQTGRIVPRDVLRIAENHGIDIHEPLNLAKYTGSPELVGETDTPALGVTGGIRWEDPKMEPRRERIYPPPFTKCDREADMRQAYRVFEERLKKERART